MGKLTFPVLLLCLGVLIACANTLNAAVDPQTNLFTITDSFRAELKKQGFIIPDPKIIKKPELVDNLDQIKGFFGNNAQAYFTYTRLTNYLIKNIHNKKMVNLYCYQFENTNNAKDWYNTITNSNKFLIRTVFRRPKKTMGLSDGYVILLEGYNMSDDTALRYIMGKLDNIKAVIHAAPRDR